MLHLTCSFGWLCSKQRFLYVYIVCSVKELNNICLLPSLTPFNVLKVLLAYLGGNNQTRGTEWDFFLKWILWSSFRWIHIWMYRWCIFLPLSGFLSKDKLIHIFSTFLLQQLREGFLVELEFIVCIYFSLTVHSFLSFDCFFSFDSFFFSVA